VQTDGGRGFGNHGKHQSACVASGTARAAKSLVSACTGKEKRRAMATKTSARRMFPDLQEYVMLQER